MTTTINTSTGYALKLRLGMERVKRTAEVLRTAVFICLTIAAASFTAVAPFTAVAQSSLTEPAVYVLKPGAGNLDYFTYFSDSEKFDVSAFNIQSFADLQSQILEGELALQQGGANDANAMDAIRFTLQSDKGQVTVMIQHSDCELNASHFVYAAPDNRLSRVAGSP